MTPEAIKDIAQFLELLDNESDRGKVLISTGFMEEQLREVLTSFMLDCPKAKEFVGGGNAPLSTFSSRITGCYVLGLITKDEHDALDLIRKIRNEFAHNIHTTFESPKVADRCRELVKKEPFKSTVEEMGDNKRKSVIYFITVAGSLITLLTERPDIIAQKRCSLPKN